MNKHWHKALLIIQRVNGSIPELARIKKFTQVNGVTHANSPPHLGTYFEDATLHPGDKLLYMPDQAQTTIIL